jgi:hypothetical protein
LKFVRPREKKVEKSEPPGERKRKKRISVGF